MRKIIAFVLFTVMTISLVACSGNTVNSDTSNATGKKSAETNNAEIANPFKDCDTLDEACNLAGFDISLPDTMDGYEKRVIRVIENELIEIIYSNEGDEIRIRKAAGGEDISGDYNSYIENNTITAGELQVTIRGEDSKVQVATWVNGDYTFSLGISAGMSNDSVVKLIQDIQ